MNYIMELAQFQNKVYVPTKDKLDVSPQFGVMSRTNLLHTYTQIHTYTQTFSRKRIFWLRELENIENHRNNFFRDRKISPFEKGNLCVKTMKIIQENLWGCYEAIKVVMEGYKIYNSSIPQIDREPRGFTWPIEVHGYTKVPLTYFGRLNSNFEGDKPENDQKISFLDIRKIFIFFFFLNKNIIVFFMSFYEENVLKHKHFFI